MRLPGTVARWRRRYQLLTIDNDSRLRHQEFVVLKRDANSFVKDLNVSEQLNAIAQASAQLLDAFAQALQTSFQVLSIRFGYRNTRWWNRTDGWLLRTILDGNERRG